MLTISSQIAMYMNRRTLQWIAIILAACSWSIIFNLITLVHSASHADAAAVDDDAFVQGNQVRAQWCGIKKLRFHKIRLYQWKFIKNWAAPVITTTTTTTNGEKSSDGSVFFYLNVNHQIRYENLVYMLNIWFIYVDIFRFWVAFAARSYIAFIIIHLQTLPPSVNRWNIWQWTGLSINSLQSLHANGATARITVSPSTKHKR